MLVSTEQLAARVNDPAWIIFDCRHDLMNQAKGAQLYRDGHIPGAHFVPVETALSGAKTGRNGRHPLPTAEAFADFLGRHGVTEASTIVAYDDVGGQYAARLWWMARWIGLTRVVLLDGGFPKWIAEARGVATTVPQPTPVALSPRLGAQGLWRVEDVLASLHNPDTLLLDARTAERFRGEVEPIDVVAGRIPGAVNRFFKTNLQANLTFRPVEELKREFETVLAGRKAENIAHQCGSGVTACVNLFAMEYAGLRGSKLYAGSWSEWISDPARPVAKG